MRLLIAIGRVILNGIYALHKLNPIKNQVTIISRQSDEPSLDIRLLAQELESRQDIQVKVLCKTLSGGLFSKVKYLFHMVSPQMRAMAASKVVVLDSYCIAASILRHRKGLSIIQMWHAMGGFKKFGYSILNQGEGSQAWLAEAMRMHKNYTCVLASSEETIGFLGEAFGYGRDAFKILPLPRTDLLHDQAFMERKAEEIKIAIPDLSPEKKTILYAPTFRKTRQGREGITDLIDALDYENYNLMVALHPLMDPEQLPEKAITTKRFSTLEMLSVCDYFITDYSAMIYEAALVEKPIFLYAYDLRDYTGKRGFYIDYEKDLPGKPYTDVRELVKAIETDQYDLEKIRMFAQRYVASDNQCAKKLADLICEEIKDV